MNPLPVFFKEETKAQITKQHADGKFLFLANQPTFHADEAFGWHDWRGRLSQLERSADI